MSYDFTGATVSSTYGRIVQVVHGSPDLYYDGFGNLLNLGAGTASIGPQGPTGSQGTSMVFQGEWDSMMMYFYYDFVTYNGSAYLCISDLTGSAPWSSPDVDNTHWEKMLIGLSGTSGTSGVGATGSNGTNGTSGTSGIGTNGSSGTSGSNGTSGTSGLNGLDGSSGTSGLMGSSGSSGTSGYGIPTGGTSGQVLAKIDGSDYNTHWVNQTGGSGGLDGTNGTSGLNGLDGTNGTSGINGLDGTSGTSGLSGSMGTSGTSASSGTMGTSGTSVSTNYVYKTSAYSVLSSDYYIEANGTFDVTLPTAVGLSGKTFIIKNSGTGIITIQTTSSQLIDNLPSYNLAFYDTLVVESNGSNWLVRNPQTKSFVRVYNNTGSIIPKGTALKIQSSYLGIPSVTLPIASLHATNQQVIGLAYIDIPNASEGIAISSGILSGLNLSSYSVGDILYLSDTVAGGFVNSTDSLQFSSRTNQIGYVTSTSSTIGTIQVEINNEDINLTLTDIERNILEGNVISTGVYHYLGMTKTSSTTFTVASASGWVVINTGAFATKPDVQNVIYSGTTSITTPYLNSADSTYVLLTASSSLVLQSTFPTPQERRESIYLGKVVHPDRQTILNVNNTVDHDVSPVSQIRDLWTPIKLINQGIVASAHSTTLEINTSSGTLWGNGINWVANELNPNSLIINAQSPVTFAYRTQTGGTYSNTTFIDPGYYDVAGVRTAVGGGAGSSTNQRIFLFPTGLIRVQYGQKVYGTLAEAINGAQDELFVDYPNNRDNGILIGILSVNKSVSNLSDTTKARFNLVSKFGEILGGSGGLSTTTLQQAYDNSSTPEIVTNTSLGAVTFKRGSASDSDNVIEVQSGNGINGVTFSVTGQGKTTTNTLVIKNIGLTSSATKYMVVDDFGNTFYQTTIIGNGGATGPAGPTGAGGALGYYGSFYDTTNQLNPTASFPNIMKVNSVYEANGVSVTNGNDKLTFANDGTYNIQFSTVFSKSNANPTDIDIWFSKNGSYITQSNTQFTIAGNSAIVASWNFINTIKANDYIQLYWSSTETTVSILATGTQSNPIRPAVPSVILTAQQVMYNQIGATGNSGSSGTSGISGTSGTSGSSGSSGTSGENGSSGTSGSSGTDGYSAQYIGNSTDTIDLATLIIGNTFSLVTTNGLEYSIAQHLIVAYSNDNHFHGDVVSYSHSTGLLVLDVSGINGSGTFSNWITNLDGAAGGNGSSGTSGSSGSSGSSGTSGLNGSSGSSGTSGTSGLLSLTGTTNNGVITLNTSAPNAIVEANLTFDGENLVVTGNTQITGSISGSYSTNNIASDALIQAGLLFLSNNC